MAIKKIDDLRTTFETRLKEFNKVEVRNSKTLSFREELKHDLYEKPKEFEESIENVKNYIEELKRIINESNKTIKELEKSLKIFPKYQKQCNIIRRQCSRKD